MGEGPGVPRHRHLWARLMGRASLGVRRNLWFPAKIAGLRPQGTHHPPCQSACPIPQALTLPRGQGREASGSGACSHGPSACCRPAAAWPGTAREGGTRFPLERGLPAESCVPPARRTVSSLYKEGFSEARRAVKGFIRAAPGLRRLSLRMPAAGQQGGLPEG